MHGAAKTAIGNTRDGRNAFAGRLGDRSYVHSCSHDCPVCGHPASGPAVTGSLNVLINTRPALRVRDRGIHAACCGPNTWLAEEGASAVLINNHRVHRLGDAVRHCGGAGHLVEASSNVLIGDHGRSSVPAPKHWVEFVVTDGRGKPLRGVLCKITLPGDEQIFATTNRRGLIRFERISPGECRIEIANAIPHGA